LHFTVGLEGINMDKDDTFGGRVDRYLRNMTTAVRKIINAGRIDVFGIALDRSSPMIAWRRDELTSW
jgi:hypothetical protein